MRTSQSRLVREAVMREPDAGRYVHIRPRRLPPGCLDRVEALADKHGIDRDVARRLAAELHRYAEASCCKCPAYTSRPSTTRAATRAPRSTGACAIAQRLGRGKLALVEPLMTWSM
jgi:hypothetical protein